MSPLRQLLWSVYLPSLIFSIGSGAVQPVVVLAALKLGFSDAGASAVMGVFGIVTVLTAPLLGRMISARGDRPSLIMGSFIALGALSLALTSLFFPGPTWSQVSFIGSLALLAIAGNIWSLGRQAFIADNLPPIYRARGLSTLGGMLRVGVLIGPLLATGLLALWALEAVFVLNIVTVLISLALVVKFFVPPAEDLNSHPQPETTSHTVSHPQPPTSPVTLPHWPSTILMGAGIFALSVLRSNKNVIIPLWGTALGLPEHVITLAFGCSAFIDSTMFYPIGKITDKRGRLYSLLPALLIMSAGIVLMVTWQTPVGFFVASALLGLGNGCGSGIVMTLGADLSPPHNRAAFLGTWAAITNTGNAGGPYIASAMTAILSLSGALWATAVIGFLGAAWFALLLPRTYRTLGLDVRGNRLES